MKLSRNLGISRSVLAAKLSLPLLLSVRTAKVFAYEVRWSKQEIDEKILDLIYDYSNVPE
ncbi:hypothetical protein HK096_010049, partial [Nowakowskiella sp. JEL0078]